MNHTVFAQGIENPILSGTLGRGTSLTGLLNAGNFISSLISLFLVIATIATLIYLVVGGLAWVTSEGEKGKLEQARNRITQALIGLIIVASSWAIWSLLGNFIGIDVENIPFPTLTQEINLPYRGAASITDK